MDNLVVIMLAAVMLVVDVVVLVVVVVLVYQETLPGRLELPTLRLTASRSNQLSYGSHVCLADKAFVS